MNTAEEEYYLAVIQSMKGIVYDLERVFAPKKAIELISSAVHLCLDDLESRRGSASK